MGGTAWNTLKGVGTEKRGRETKILKRRKLGKGVAALKRVRAGALSQNMSSSTNIANDMIHVSDNGQSLM